MESLTRVLCSLAVVGGLNAGFLWLPSDVFAQTTTDPNVITPPERSTTERAIDQGPGTTSTDQGPGTTSTTPRTDEAIAERNRRMELERELARLRERDRDRHGETYIAGYGGTTFGGTTSGMEGRGSNLGQSFADQNLANSGVYGIKMGYFHPGRLNWLGLEIEGYNSTPHLKETGGTPGSHLRLSMLGLNAIARTKMACRDKRRDGDSRRDTRADDARRADDAYDSPLDDNARCPLQLYAGAGLGVFFAETSNQFGRSTDNARAGLNALAGVKFFLNKHVALFAEYKFNYVDLKFDQNQFPGGSTGGLNGTYMINHVVGGLAVHF
jgi:opacity protein-like surface antigen